MRVWVRPRVRARVRARVRIRVRVWVRCEVVRPTDQRSRIRDRELLRWKLCIRPRPSPFRLDTKRVRHDGQLLLHRVIFRKAKFAPQPIRFGHCLHRHGGRGVLCHCYARLCCNGSEHLWHRHTSALVRVWVEPVGDAVPNACHTGYVCGGAAAPLRLCCICCICCCCMCQPLCSCSRWSGRCRRLGGR